jgi:uncharacterized protein YbaP (TraB family)
MIRRLIGLVVALALCGVPATASAKSFVWKVTSPKGAVLYLAGSVHLLSKDYYPLDAAFENAFNVSSTLVEELDMGEMLTPAAQMSMLQRGMLPAGQTLQSVISPETMTAVSKAITELGMPIAPLTQFKPWMLAITLQSLAWQKSGFDADLGLDKHFYDKAKAVNKRVRGLETLDFQITRFDGMTPALQDQMLRETVTELNTTKESFSHLADAWKVGDVGALESQILDDLRSQPEMYQRLLVDRNRTWLPTLESLAGTPPAFVVVGAAHLLGTDGLLQMLQAKGYTIEQL